MKKAALFLCSLALVFGLAGAASATTYTESYAGSQAFDSADTNNNMFYFVFDFKSHNDADLATNSSLEASDIEGMVGPWSSAILNISFSNLDGCDQASFEWTSYDADDDQSDPWTIDLSQTNTYTFKSDELSDFEWGDLYITALEGSFDITYVGLTVEKTAPVPEPATMLLLGAGLVGLAAGGRKRLFGRR